MGNGYGSQGWGMGDGMGWGGWLMMGFFTIVCLAVLGGLAYVLLRGSRSGGTPGNGYCSADPEIRPRSLAERTLDERFARGEIDEPEYQHRKGVLHAR